MCVPDCLYLSVCLSVCLLVDYNQVFQRISCDRLLQQFDQRFQYFIDKVRGVNSQHDEILSSVFCSNYLLLFATIVLLIFCTLFTDCVFCSCSLILFTAIVYWSCVVVVYTISGRQ